MRRAFITAIALVVLGGVAFALESSPDGEIFFLSVRANNEMAHFTYDRVLSQYEPDTGWLSGDRLGYDCAFTFLEHDGQIVARVTFVRIAQANYVRINDKFMYEGGEANGLGHDWYGNPYPPNPPNDNQRVCLDGKIPAQAMPTGYQPASGPIGPLPVVVFTDAASGHTLEVRNYANVIQEPAPGTSGGPGYEFEIISATPDRVTVLEYQNGIPGMAVYYDRLSPAIHLTSNGVG